MRLARGGLTRAGVDWPPRHAGLALSSLGVVVGRRGSRVFEARRGLGRGRVWARPIVTIDKI